MAKYPRDPNHHLRGEIMCRWSLLTVSEIDECCTDRFMLIDVLQRRYGFARSRAEKEADLFFEEFQNRLRLAA